MVQRHLLVRFSDNSTGGLPSLWNWSFGDGTWFNTSLNALKNPEHVYLTPGSYTVNLTILNITVFSTLSRSDYVTVVSPMETTVPTTSPTPAITPTSSPSSLHNLHSGSYSYVHSFSLSDNNLHSGSYLLTLTPSPSPTTTTLPLPSPTSIHSCSQLLLLIPLMKVQKMIMTLFLYHQQQVFPW